MKQFFKENRRLLIVAVLALIAGVVIGVFIGLNLPKDPDAAEAGNLGKPSVLPTTSMERQVYYTRCGHCKTERVDQTGFVGYTEAELADFYENDHISAFSGTEVLLIRTVTGCCPDHLLLRRGDGGLSVLQTDEQTQGEKLIQLIPLEDASRFSQADWKELETGMVFGSLGEIDAFLESMES